MNDQEMEFAMVRPLTSRRLIARRYDRRPSSLRAVRRERRRLGLRVRLECSSRLLEGSEIHPALRIRQLEGW